MSGICECGHGGPTHRTDMTKPLGYAECEAADCWPCRCLTYHPTKGAHKPSPSSSRSDARAAARLRSLAAIYEQPLNRDKTFTFTGRELAAMLKDGAE